MRCSRCEGIGRVTYTARDDIHGEYLSTKTCPQCDGIGKVPAEYWAANGHLMVTVEWHNGRRVQWNAQHSEKCPCTTSEDW